MRRLVSTLCLVALAACGSHEQKGEQQAANAIPKPEGQVLFERHCAACHGSGADKPGTVALAARYEGSEPGELLQRKDLPPDMIKAVVRIGIANMPPFRKTEIGDAELDKLADWLSSHGQAAQPPK